MTAVTSHHASSHDEASLDVKAAFDKTAKYRAALDPKDFATINVDIPLAVSTVVGALPRLEMLREGVADLPGFDIAGYNRIQTYAEALLFAHTAFLATSSPTEALPTLVVRASELRDQFLTDATALARRGLVDRKRLDELKGGTGYLAVASDVGVLVSMFRERWKDIKTKSAIQASELDEAEQLYPRIVFGMGERAQQPIVAAAASDDRQRAFTLLVNAYDQARRAATYVRWEENDVDRMLPSLWAQKGSGRPSGKTASGNGDPATTPVTPPAVAVPTPVAPPPAPAETGLPGGSPFAHS